MTTRDDKAATPWKGCLRRTVVNGGGFPSASGTTGCNLSEQLELIHESVPLALVFIGKGELRRSTHPLQQMPSSLTKES